ncbi:N-acetylglucosaminyl-diphospho-decaprenol L-rhamnosyltransferase [Thiorhodovibrio winogradskyi]|uniref:N-acetylglucosaminyl-diphospho-decaprenol L-rhamnosyltransferase n=1 Tax=Thiorhodovibrio winogradskyi TaxID=77007 RepID=A0ABZ0S4X6_9GAMM|nr:glycosyltransferase [Thiorhodovibrio winogradskyi]
MANRALQQRYGGVILRHARDPQRYQPSGETDPAPPPVFTRELSLAANSQRLQALLAAITRHGDHPAPRDPAFARLAALPALGPLPRALLSAEPSARDGVSIIILSLRGAALLERLLSSFLATNSQQPVELIIVDHGDPHDAADPTAAVLARYQAQLDLWHLPRGRNYSFSDSCNLAAGLARYPTLLFLNNDIHYSADALPPALAQLRDPRCGLVGIRLDDDPAGLPPGQEPGIQHLGIHFPWSAERGYHHPRQIRLPSVKNYLAGSPPAVSEQPAVTGAFLLCRKADFDQLGGFSPAYDYGLEDIDLCLRMHQALGKSSRCLSAIGLQHAESTTRRRDPERTRARIARNHQHFKQHWQARTQHLAHPPRPQPAPAAPRNLLFVLPMPLDSNSGYHVQHHAAQLRAQGIDCRVAVPDGQPTSDQSPLPSRSHSQVLSDPAASGFANGRGPDLIHAWTPRECVRRLVEPLRRATGARLLVHLEDNEEHLTEVALGRPYAELARLPLAELDRLIPGHRYHPQRGQWLLDRADGLTLIASPLARFNRRRLPAQRLPAPVDESLFAPRPRNQRLRQAQGIPDQACVLAYTGNVHHANQHEVAELYRALARLNQQGLPTVLLRTGHTRPVTPMPAVPASAVRELGWVERAQVPEILAAADLLIQSGDPGPFNDQRLPSKLPEYFAMGRPVILAQGHPDLCPRHGEHAWLVESTSAAQLAEAVRTLWHDRALAERLAQGARCYYEDHLRGEPGALFDFIRRMQAEPAQQHHDDRHHIGRFTHDNS